MQDDLSTEVLDLGAARRGELTESYLTSMGAMLQIALQRMFAGAGGSMKVTGSRKEVESLKRTLSGEKRYMDSFMKHGLDDPRTFKSKSQLMRAVKEFERATGLKWPFK
tara:strand:- start:622 stop:948 length:327 start_codon:yes stop_codon:yes gene_type:complete